MAAYIPVRYALADALCCLGLGLLTAAGHQALGWLLGRSRLALFWRDIAAFLLAAVLGFSFAASRSYSGLIRWYMVLGLAAGAWCYRALLADAVQATAQWLAAVVCSPLVWSFRLGRALCRPVWQAAGRRRAARRQKRAKAKQKRLQKDGRGLYNSNQ